MIMIVFQSQQNSIVAVEYSNEDRVRLLREGRVVEEKINALQTKYYKYVNNDKNVKKVAVNVNVISGNIDVKGQRKDFRMNETNYL